ncbi:UDP-N-acetylmuramoyl-tripeptide--D-alanyl-D-alanine ligase [Ferrithrix thermotolerans DSM 19514]|uniref:UDP-N-acetylmuramoyl-tripeptide--D-alanyl-D-alanine ligase n=1 Tax=Ferrithrix thermotolerans DSM 19514 TaxID=1121881 RepID=A0A1M4S5B1_9ACTN|nr:Mur ligase family protein [Ferrithrix thermotolerans]SHE27360.1 UDP-N-acetylmuramoyl-tripeptide--D-alanyl-D-alanine ligase [Ferrithrix thermotolerans DSM 19514]
MSTGDYVLAVAIVLGTGASVVSAIKWLRVAQREHYIVGYTTRFAIRWWSYKTARINSIVFVLAYLLAGFESRNDLPLSLKDLVVGVVLVVVAVFPLGLSLRGRTSKLAVTARMKRLMVALAAVYLLGVGVSLALEFEYLYLALVPLLMPVLVEVALWITRPIEARGLSRFVSKAEAKLKRTQPKIVAISGSFGKTTTKNYIATLARSSMSVVASPASYNNRAGLARTINEHLEDSVELFVAEMGTFSHGEIASLCTWIPPDVAVMCALGPVHLERFGSEDQILKAELEVTDACDVVIVNVDYPKLALAANDLEQAGKKVYRVSEKDFSAFVSVKSDDEGKLVVYLEQRRIGAVDEGDISPGNLACAVAAALAVGVPESAVADSLSEIKAPPNRLNAVVAGEQGVEVLDDTYNSNPAGARRALAALKRRVDTGKRGVVVTPGMIELGHKQFIENYRFARAIAEVASILIIVGRTNQEALRRGAKEGASGPDATLTQIVEVRTREAAVAWVREHLSDRDVVLYENDLPDHFP